MPQTQASSQQRCKIAVASSGLGYIRRGIETWAEDLALALTRAGEDVTLFQGGDTASPTDARREILRTPARQNASLLRWVEFLRARGGWRCGFGSPYQAEQTLFALRLWTRIRSDYDILNVQDPWLARILDGLHRRGLSRPRVILAHGTEETPRDLAPFAYLQHLAPCYLDDWQQHQPAAQTASAVPNFVDTARFRPGDKNAARAKWDLPPDSLIVLCVAAIKKNHKRVDYLLREFDAFSARWPGGTPPLLVIAGAREEQTDEVIAMGRSLLGNRVRFLEGVDRAAIPDLYRAADVFALASLHEMMPIALLEALASGLPVVCNDTPTLRWMAGPAGRLSDIAQEGALARQLTRVTAPELRDRLARDARLHAEATFSEAVVVRQYQEMYHAVTARGAKGAKHP